MCNFLNLQRRSTSDARPADQGDSRILRFYANCSGYAANAKPKIFHILWNNKFQFFDRTLLMMFYRLLGKEIVL